MNKQQEYFIQNLTLLLRSGMPVLDAVASLAEEMRGAKIQKALATVREEISNGSNISSALEKADLLPTRYITLLKIGEETGQLTEQLSLIGKQMNKEKSLRGHVVQSLMYPAAVLAVTFVVGTLTVAYTFPKLVTIFTSFGGQLPLSTRIIIAIGEFLSGYGILVVPLFLGLVALAVFLLFFYPKTKRAGERLLFMVPAISSVVQQIELARFGYMLGTLMHAGVSIPQALESLEDGSTMLYYKDFYAGMRADIIGGNSLFSSVKMQPHSARYVPPHVASLLSAGERGGALSDTLLTIGATYEEAIDAVTGNLSAVLEPLIIVIVGLIVAIVAFSIITPIYGLVNRIS